MPRGHDKNSQLPKTSQRPSKVTPKVTPQRHFQRPYKVTPKVTPKVNKKSPQRKLGGH